MLGLAAFMVLTNGVLWDLISTGFFHVVLECRHPSLCGDRPLPLEKYLFMMLVLMMFVGAALIFNLYEPAPR